MHNFRAFAGGRHMAKAVPPVFRSSAGRASYYAAYDAVLRAWPVPFEELDIPTPQGLTHVIASGPSAAPPLLLLPSLAASAMLWQPNIAALSTHFRVYAVDIIGQVGKSVPAKRIRTRQEMAEWLSALMDGLGVGRASLVGASYGGFLAMNQAVSTTERVDRVALIGPAATFVRLPWKFYYAMLIKGPLRRLFRRKASPRWSGERPSPVGSFGSLMASAMLHSAKPNLAPAIVFSKSELLRVKAPVLLLIGEREVLYDPQTALEKARKRIPGLSGAVISGADHLASLSAPEAVSNRLVEFLTPSQPS